MKYLDKEGEVRRKSTLQQRSGKEYHPDRHQDNPLQDLAEEKLQESTSI
jgi:curved DNA-binding protein CbpA